MDSLSAPIISTVSALAAALAVGAVVGLERGWRERERAEGSRVAGLRTFALFGLLGGVLGVLSDTLGPWPLATGLAGLSILAAVSYRENVRTHGSLSATTAVAALLTYALGALAGVGQAAIAVGAAIVVAMLLDLKPTLHRWLRLVEHRELSAALQLLVLSVVILPLLPDAGYGPYDALNPYRLWWAVVLIAALSLCGHVAMRLTGPQRGIFWTGLLGGLASSTAATLTLGRRARAEPGLTDAAAAGALAACAMMFLRMTVIVFSLQPALGRALGVPMVTAGVTLLGLGALQWKRRLSGDVATGVDHMSPFDLNTALGFGAFLGVMAVLTQASKEWWGNPGLYVLATLSGLADVDAIVITVMRMQAAGSVGVTATVTAVGIATVANMVTKASIAAVTGGALLGRRVAAGYSLSIAAGAAAAAIMFASQVGVVTGASSGIDRAIALACAHDGVKVVVSEPNTTGGEETVAIISAARRLPGAGREHGKPLRPARRGLQQRRHRQRTRPDGRLSARRPGAAHRGEPIEGLLLHEVPVFAHARGRPRRDRQHGVYPRDGRLAGWRSASRSKQPCMGRRR